MPDPVPIARLRDATEDDVRRALDGAWCENCGEPTQLLEFWNRMLDVLAGVEEE